MLFEQAYAGVRTHINPFSQCSSSTLPEPRRLHSRFLPVVLLVSVILAAPSAWVAIPVADNQTVNIDEDDTNEPITLTGSDPDPLDTITGYTVDDTGLVGSLSGTAPNLSYTPPPNFDDSTSFSFTVTAGGENSLPATVTINVAPVNDQPTADDLSPSTDEDTPVVITLTGSDIDGDGLTFNPTTNPSNGALSGSPPNLTYTPGPGFGGPDEFEYVAFDGTVNSDPATVSITVISQNDAPVANDDSVATNEDVPLVITLTATDDDGDGLTYEIVSGPSDGALTLSFPNVTYTPDENFNGNDSFRFRANDGTVNSNTATISITVNPQNDPPTTTPLGPQMATEGQPYSLNMSDNFDDVDDNGAGLQYTATGLPPSLTPIGLNSGVISGTPTQAEAINNGGVYNVVVTARDPLNESVQNAFTLTIGAVNDRPVADNNPNVVTDEDTSVPIILTGSDADGNPITYSVVRQPMNGTLSGAAPNLTYMPNPNYNGNDDFTFTVSDGTLTSEIGTVTITINPVNDLPVLVTPILDVQVSETEDVDFTIAGNFDDPDNDGLTFSAIGLPASLAPIHPASGTIDGVPTQAEAQANGGVYMVSVTATDGQGDSVSDTFQLLVVELARANVGLTVSAAPTPAMLNDQVQFNFVVRNNGPEPATSIELDGTFIGNGLTITPTGATTCTVQNSSGDFNCMIGNLNLGATTSLAIGVATTNPGAVTVAATAAVSTQFPLDPDLQDNSAQYSVGIAESFSNGAVQVLGNSQVLSVAHGDLNNDGFDDIVLGTGAGQPVQVFLSDGFRGFGAAIAVPDNSAQNGIALADFDNNGTLDMALANAGVPDTVYGNNGAGSFSLMATLPGATLSNDVAYGFFDSNGNADLIFAVNGPNLVYLGDGSGGFTLDSTLGNADSRAVAVGELTGNNRMDDAVFANVGSPSSQWNGLASVGNNPDRTFNIGDASSVVIAELIGGSDANAFDVAFGRIPTDVGDIPGNPVFSNNGNGGLSLSRTLGAAPTNDILAGDVDRDGQNDLVFVNATGVHQIWNRSGGNFSLHSEQIVDDDAVSGVVANFGDTDVGEPGGVDLIMGGNPAPGAGLYLNDGLGNLGMGDITAPTQVLNGNDPMEISSGTTFADPRTTATDNIDGDISARVVATGNVNAAVVGTYMVTYNVTDRAGNVADPITRTVVVVPGTGTGGGGGGTLSPFAIWFLLAMLLVSYAGRRAYISTLTNKKNQ
jgi:hypothetical protein